MVEVEKGAMGSDDVTYFTTKRGENVQGHLRMGPNVLFIRYDLFVVTIKVFPYMLLKHFPQ